MRFVWLRPQHGDQVAQFVVDIARRHNGVGDFLAQKLPVPQPQTIGRLSHRALGRSQFARSVGW